MKKSGLPDFSHLIRPLQKREAFLMRMNKVAAKRPETKEGGREEEKSRSRIATGLTAPGRLRGNNLKISAGPCLVLM